MNSGRDAVKFFPSTVFELLVPRRRLFTYRWTGCPPLPGEGFLGGEGIRAEAIT